MTTITKTAPRDRDGELRRVVNVVRMHLTNRFPLLVLPWMILGFIFLVNVAIWWIVMANTAPEDHAQASEGMQFSGATTFIFVYMLVVAVQAVNLTFPFALGFSVTRRDFYLGTSLVFVLLSAYYALGMTILAEIERATNGWGLGGAMFDVIYFGADTFVQRFALFFLLFLFFFFIGAIFASVYVRWRSNGMIVFGGILVLIVLGLVALVTFTDNWATVGNWFVRTGPMGVAVWSLVPTALAAIGGYILLRRATVKG